MARLSRESPSGEGHATTDATFTRSESSQARNGASKPSQASGKARVRTSPRKKLPALYREAVGSDSERGDNDDNENERLVPKVQQSPQRRKQIRLAPLQGFSSSASLQPIPIDPTSPRIDRQRVKNAEREASNSSLSSQPRENTIEPQKLELGDTVVEYEVEESVWCESSNSSDSDDDNLPSPRTFLRFPTRPKCNSSAGSQDAESTSEQRNLVDPFVRPQSGKQRSIVASRPSSSSDKENNDAFLKFSPPRLHIAPKHGISERTVTPPQSPSKSRLQSPSKTRVRMPTPPLRPSLDAFWNVDTVNKWNDQYSPKKTLKSPKKFKLLQDDGPASPTASPRKANSPSKKTKAELLAKKEFEARKHRVAEDFFSELDDKVTQGRIHELATSTGGVKFIWSKTLNSTAGRANWRRETTKTKKLDGTVEVDHKHHASIELAEKVIDDEHRLLNVIAHEFCHLANFMVSGVKNQPHGRDFKAWGRKCTQAFKDRGVEVTTKHSYEIEYRYIWQCSNEECAAEFKRHSKSIDPKRHTCGSCRGKLIQTKPAPRKEAGEKGYAAYVKQHFAEVKPWDANIGWIRPPRPLRMRLIAKFSRPAER